MDINETKKIIKAIAKEAGIDVTITKAAKIPPKYRNPENPEQTWTGRGIAPSWTKSVNLEQCRI